MISQQQIYLVSRLLYNENISLLDLLCAYICGHVESYELSGPARTLRDGLCTPAALNKLFGTLLKTLETNQTTLTLARNITVHHYIKEMGSLLTPAAGFHFRASHAASAQFEQFTNVKMAKKMEEACPTLWELFGILLNGSAMRDASSFALRQEAYLTELALGKEAPATATPQKRPRTHDTAVAVSDDMPDEDWGGQSDMDDSSDEDEGGSNASARPLEPDVGHEATARWTTAVGARRRKKGDALKRQMRRTMVVSRIASAINKRCSRLCISAMCDNVQHMYEQQQRMVQRFAIGCWIICPFDEHTHEGRRNDGARRAQYIAKLNQSNGQKHVG